MTDTLPDLPQEWPDSVAPDATVLTSKTASPLGEPLLDFSAMSGTTFEQFCWWLLKKDHTLAGCKRLGGEGKAQGGIDLFAFDAQETGKLSVFECKAWRTFDPTRLTKAVDAFLEGPWAASTRTFTMIVAQQDMGGGQLALRWATEKERLKQAGIEGDLWTAHTLTQRVQTYPDILSKFFPWHSIDLFANRWMERVAFYELVSKAFFDPRERVARWARDLVAQSASSSPQNRDALPSAQSGSVELGDDGYRASSLEIDGIHRQVSRNGNSWHFKGPWFSLSAVVPDRQFARASAAISFARPDVAGITLTVGHTWLLKKFLFGTDAPLTPTYRGFVAGALHQNPDQYLVDLPNCRIFFQKDGAREIAGVADLLTDVMRDALVELETAWCAVDFPFVTWAGNKVALAAVDESVWQEIGRFVEAHDVDNGTTPWHMFDANRNVLKPYHKRSTEQYDAGYHAIVYATKINQLSIGREVVLLWQPNDLDPNQTFSQRGDWSCEYVLEWLTVSLLPAVKQWVYEREFGKWWKLPWRAKQARAFADHLDRIFVVRDLREPPLMRHNMWCASIVKSAEALQIFFHARAEPAPFIRRREMEALYRAIAIVAQGKRGYVGYVSSKLGLRREIADHTDLIDAIHEHIREGRVGLNSFVADCAFRAMLELLGDCDVWLAESDQGAIRASMVPFARLRDDAILVDRHTKWC
ncbi:hypothetical protein [Cupriavidus sp. MP-37]|uniref:hypothetical protein n=1 Tax=Cupriavidus sp. MP-37 TaxID=2884455 RepID=UPI001D0B695F|nr:hypothetical protein [Cupriavidus sp. MP-37]UDM52042.1 hypothetical protein LIN44_22665 [Cupriavidus sp. MP-37]